MREIQRRRRAKLGEGRALHRHAILGLRGHLEVLDGLPEYARHGLFARAGRREALIRLSNGSMDRQPDKTSDIRGYAIKVLGVEGPGALGLGPVTSQDFLLINRETFSSPKSDEFMGIVTAVSRGPLALLGHLVRTHGLLGGLSRAKALAAGLKAPFSGFATTAFHSAAPIACGPHAARVRLQPAAADPTPGASSDWAAEVRARLARGPLVHELQLQFFESEATTPIEDASVSWSSPYLTVARLSVHEAPEDAAFTAQVEAGVFDPWNALAEHRPLGDVMRARKAVYYASQQERSATAG
jgi:hypothetical protein